MEEYQKGKLDGQGGADEAPAYLPSFSWKLLAVLKAHLVH